MYRQFRFKPCIGSFSIDLFVINDLIGKTVTGVKVFIVLSNLNMGKNIHYMSSW